MPLSQQTGLRGAAPLSGLCLYPAPLLPYVYGLAGQITGYSLCAGRALTALLALASAFMAGAVARRRGGPIAEVVALALIAGSLFTATAYTYTATYALTAFFLVLAIFVATSRLTKDWRAVIAGLALAAAAGTRLSVVAALPFMVLAVALCAKRRWRSLLIAGAATIAGLALIFSPFLLFTRENMLYDVFGFHTDRTTLIWQAAAVQNTARETVTDFAVLLGVTLTGAAAQFVRLRRPGQRTGYAFEVAGHPPQLAGGRAATQPGGNGACGGRVPAREHPGRRPTGQLQHPPGPEGRPARAPRVGDVHLLLSAHLER